MDYFDIRTGTLVGKDDGHFPTLVPIVPVACSGVFPSEIVSMVMSSSLPRCANLLNDALVTVVKHLVRDETSKFFGDAVVRTRSPQSLIN
jgi:hypothetical protein